MIDFIDKINEIKIIYNIEDNNFSFELSRFLVSRNWFREKPKVENGQVKITENFWTNYSQTICNFASLYDKTASTKKKFLFDKFNKSFPKTMDIFKNYSTKANLDDNTICILVEFLNYNLIDEVINCNDAEIKDLLDCAFNDLKKSYSDILTEFLNLTNKEYKTAYHNYFFMREYGDGIASSKAYSPDEYLEMLYFLFNEDYIEKNDMYEQASNSKNYIDTWLFLSLHFICTIRNTDLIKIPHPKLPDEPQKILDSIINYSFTDESARAVLFSILWNFEAFQPIPNKTKSISNVSSLKFMIPTSVEVHMGKLFAIAESHHRLMGGNNEEPLIHSISSYEQITRYMGDEIGDLFLESNFRSRSANKSLLQIIQIMTDEILEGNDEFNVKGGILAALARSHKGSYGEFAETTSIYLKDAKMSGYSPEFVAKEMFERGVLSTIPSMLLKMITDGDYQKLSLTNQTKMIKTLNLTPYEVENIVQLAKESYQNSVKIVSDIYQNRTKEDICKILHTISNGNSPSKERNSECLMPALKRECPYPDRSSCINCQYSISMKTTLGVMVNEFQRLKIEYQNTSSATIKGKNKVLASKVVLPAMDEMLSCVRELYGEKRVQSLEIIIKEMQYAK